MGIRGLLFIMFFVSASAVLNAQQVSTFEMRYITDDVKADGVTDFHGETEWLDTEGRVQALGKYADFASSFWGNPGLDVPLFSDDQVCERVKAIKPQPLTSVRRTIRLDRWRSFGYKAEKEKSVSGARKVWAADGVYVSHGMLVIDNGVVTPEIDTIDWRFNLKMRLAEPAASLEVTLLGENENIEKIRLGDLAGADDFKSFNIYGDLPNHRIFVSSEGKTLHERSLPEDFGAVTGFSLASHGKASKIEDLSLYSYERTPDTPRTPFVSVLHYDEDFSDVPEMTGWQSADYDDTLWNEVSLPSALGGLKSEGESYYLRTKVKVDDFKSACLQIETLDPAGEVWVNGEVAAVLNGREPREIDVTEYLLPGQENTIAVRVKPYKAEHTMLHAPSDLNVGWFLGRTELILTGDTSQIAEGLVHTSALTDKEAVQHHRVVLKNRTSFSRKGKLQINYYPWFPYEGECVASVSKDVELRPRVDNIYEVDLTIDSPEVWSTDTPRLYKVEYVLCDDQGRPIDDYVTTTGIRVIEQKEGVLYVNHKPEMLNGGQNFGYRLPIEDMARTIRCATDEMVMRDLMMAECLGGNLLRVHVHAEKDIVDGINDPRYAEYADQMGLYLIWQSAGWLREGEAWNVDIENWPSYIRQVYDHPSIVLWEASNHPNCFKNHDASDTEDYFNAIISSIMSADTSRLVSPTSFWSHSHYANYYGTKDYQGNDMAPNPLLMHRMMTRGSQDAYTGYGAPWSKLRNAPNDWARSCLEAKDLCYFNFEHEESAAQPNWSLAIKDPWYEVPSYEWEYEKGSIGRLLEFDEWRESQAFQAFSAWESMKMQTLHGVSGFSWCSLESGANMFTYQKPLIDPYYVPKLAFYANRMVFNRIWAASGDVDTVYGPSDVITPVIFNLGDGCVADLTVELCNQKGKVVERKIIKDIEVGAGRNVTALPSFKFRTRKEGCYFVVYRLSTK